MNLYLISQDVNSDYDTYSDAVVAADTENEARCLHPSGYQWDAERGEWYQIRTVDGSRYSEGNYGSWVRPEVVTVELIGVAQPDRKVGVVCASFHAG